MARNDDADERRRRQINLLLLMTESVIPTVTLPQYLSSPAPTLQEDFEVVGDWTALTGSRAANTTEFKSGTQSIKTTSGSGTAGTITKTVNWDLSAAVAFRIWVYLHDVATTTNIQIYFSHDAGFASYYIHTALVATLHSGWNAVQLLKSDFAPSGSPNWASAFVRMRVRVSASPASTPAASWDKFQVLTALPTPAVMLMFDDGYASNFTDGYTYCKPRRVPATVFSITDNIGTGAYLSLSQMTEMYNGGWDIGNHSATHTDFTTLTQAQIETELSDAQAVLDGQGWTRASKHVAYPFGAYDADTLAAMAATSMLTGRFQHARQPIVPPGDNQYWEAQNIANTTTLAAAKVFIDTAITRGTVAALLFHSLVVTPTVPEHWAIADFQALVEYILTKPIQPITVSQMYSLQSGSVIVQDTV